MVKRILIVDTVCRVGALGLAIAAKTLAWRVTPLISPSSPQVDDEWDSPRNDSDDPAPTPMPGRSPHRTIKGGVREGTP